MKFNFLAKPMYVFESLQHAVLLYIGTFGSFIGYSAAMPQTVTASP